MTLVPLPTAQDGVPETWIVRYNYRKIVVFRNGTEVTSEDFGHPLPDWLDNITESVGEPSANLTSPVASARVSAASVVYSGLTLPSDYQWEGIIGNTSLLQYGPTCHAAFRPMKKMVINPGTSDAFYIVGYNEGGYDVMHFDTDDPLQVRDQIGDFDNVDNYADDIAIADSTGGTSGTMLLWLKRLDGTIKRYNLTDFSLYDTTTASFPGEPDLPTVEPASDLPPTGDIIARAKFIHPSDAALNRFAVYDKASEQVHVYKPTSADPDIYELNFSIGTEGGYAGGSDIRYPTTDPPENDTGFKDEVRLEGQYWEGHDNAYADRAVLCYDKDGRLWVSDTATCRVLRFDAEGNHDGTVIEWAPLSYRMCVDSAEPERVFNGYLEFKVNYDWPQSGDWPWRLVNYWGHGNAAGLLEPKGPEPANGLTSVRRFPNGKRYAIAYDDSDQHAGRGRVVYFNESLIFPNDPTDDRTTGDLESTLLVGSQQLTADTDEFDVDGSSISIFRIKYDSSFPTTARFRRYRLQGYEADGVTPDFDTEAESEDVANVPVEESDPGKETWQWGDGKIISAFHNVTRNGPSFDGWHLGAVSPSENTWLWKASHSTGGVGGSGRTDGLGTYDTYARSPQDVQFAAVDDEIFLICRGEFYRDDGQLNQIFHFRADGTFLGQFGLPQIHGTYPRAPGAGNNLYDLAVVKVNGVIYVYTTEENCRGLHRWRLVSN